MGQSTEKVWAENRNKTLSAPVWSVDDVGGISSGFLELDSGFQSLRFRFHKQIFPRFGNLNYFTWAESYFVFFALPVFLLLTHAEFFDAFPHWKNICLKAFCLFQRLVIGKVFFLTACLLVVGFWESCALLHLWGVLTFFLCLRSEWARLKSVVLHRTIRLDGKIRS